MHCLGSFDVLLSAIVASLEKLILICSVDDPTNCSFGGFDGKSRNVGPLPLADRILVNLVVIFGYVVGDIVDEN